MTDNLPGGSTSGVHQGHPQQDVSSQALPPEPIAQHQQGGALPGAQAFYSDAAQSAPDAELGSVIAIKKLMQLIDRKVEAAESLVAARANQQGAERGVVMSRSDRVEYGGTMDVDMGPLKPLLEDASINDILVNSYKDVYVERQGRLERTDIVFETPQELDKLARTIVQAVGRRLDPKRPLVDARLHDGSRVNVIAPPLSLDGISMSIRKFSADALTLNDMEAKGILGQQLSDFLKSCARAKVNMVVSGGTGSGKTTLLNAISQYIGEGDRIVTIEDSAELRLRQPHVVRLETKEGETYGDLAGTVSMGDLLKNSLRMRPDRIIVGEVRGGEAFDMIQAMNTGHEGSLTTIHANSPREGVTRIENMIGMSSAANMPANAIRKQIASAIHMFVQTMRMEDGGRRIASVSEIIGMEGEIVTMQDLFTYRKEGVDAQGNITGRHVWSGVFPRNAVLNNVVRESGIFGDGMA